MRADVAVILPAAGSGTRFGGDKLAADLGGRTVLEQSIRAFLDREDVAQVTVASPRALPASLATHPKIRQCEGGATRADTVRRALASIPADIPFVAVHDAARPLISQVLIDRCFAAARQHGAAVPGLPVTDTIKRVSDGVVIETLVRSQLVAVQTPQAARHDWLIEAFATCPLPLERVTDDVQLLELSDRAVRVVEGEPGNFKITHPTDLERACSMLQR